MLVLSFIFSWTNNFSHLDNESHSLAHLHGELRLYHDHLSYAFKEILSAAASQGLCHRYLSCQDSHGSCVGISPGVSGVECHSCTVFHAPTWLCRLQP